MQASFDLSVLSASVLISLLLFYDSPLPLYSPYPSSSITICPPSSLPNPSPSILTPPLCILPHLSNSLLALPSSPICTSNHLSFFSPLLYSLSPLLIFFKPDFTPSLPLPTLAFHILSISPLVLILAPCLSTPTTPV